MTQNWMPSPPSWPLIRVRVLIQVESAPDDFGHQQCVIHWWGYRPDLEAEGHRAQVFWGNLSTQIERWNEDRKSITVTHKEES